MAITSVPMQNTAVSAGGINATGLWVSTYLVNATHRIQGMISGDLNWTVLDSYNAQQLCAYETVSLGFSHWCSLFTYEEWQGFSIAWISPLLVVMAFGLQLEGLPGAFSPPYRGVASSSAP